METTVSVSESSQVAEVRRLVAEHTAALGMSEGDAGRAALVATEVSTNLVKYARHGVVSVSSYDDQGQCGVQLVATDQGPGIADVAGASRDGHSTGGSLGIGLGSMRRASNLFEIYSVVDQGTVVLSRVGKSLPRSATVPVRTRLEVGARNLPMPGQVHCGDAWAAVQVGRWQRLCVVDGLGHGPLAGSAAAAAVAVVVGAAESATPQDMLVLAHAALRSTRGAVMAVVAIDPVQGVLQFAGVGNVMGVLHGGDKAQHLLSVEGTVGYQMRRVRPVTHAWTPASLLVLCSDGLSTRVSLDGYPGVEARHPAIAASLLLRDFNRHSDDATVLVAKGLP